MGSDIIGMEIVIVIGIFRLEVPAALAQAQRSRCRWGLCLSKVLPSTRTQQTVGWNQVVSGTSQAAVSRRVAWVLRVLRDAATLASAQF